MPNKLQEKLNNLSELVGRAILAGKLGTQYDGDRDLYRALGYPVNITYMDYYNRYRRQDIAKAIIDRPVSTTWRGDVKIFESADEYTELEQAWDLLEKQLKLKSCFIRVDRLARLGGYAVIVLGLDDVKSVLDLSQPVKQGKRQLKYIKAISAMYANIVQYENNPNSIRYGMPVLYQISVPQPSGETINTLVHYTRIIHVVSQAIENDIEGQPVLEPVYNRLLDLEKVIGGSAEMFWRGARPGYFGKIEDGYTMTPEDLGELEAQINEFEHNLRRFLINKGVTIESLNTQVGDPTSVIDAQISMISAVVGIPKRILVGSERGELASTQDLDGWLSSIQERREEYAEGMIVRPFVDRCIELGILPAPKEDYSIQWADLWAVSEEDKVKTGAIRSTALKDYVMSPGASDMLPPEAFYKYVLCLKDEEIDWIEQLKQGMMDEEQDSIEGIADADETNI
jgi:uncharacterized protein